MIFQRLKCKAVYKVYHVLQVDGGDPHLWKCCSPGELAIAAGDACVVDMEGILEFGQVAVIGGETVESAKGFPVVLRRATLQDQSMASENSLFSKNATRRCQEKIKHYQLPMRLVRVRYSFDRSRLWVTFTADDRVDFRQLVQDLAAEMHTRIEMRQIGARDQAGIVGGLAPCGRSLCCARWLTNFENIHIRMAKLQGLSMSPAVINGMCGRLKCCLRFENNCYRDLSSALPRPGDRVSTPEGPGRVLDYRVLLQRVTVGLDDQRVLEFAAGDVKKLGSPPQNRDTAPA